MKSTTNIFCIALLAFVANNCFAQSTDGLFYVFNADWSPAKSFDKCTYFMHEKKESDTAYMCRYYSKVGPMIKQECYRDSALSIPSGFFCWYDENGKIDSCGNVLNFKKDGRWLYFMGDSTVPTYYDEYDNGKYVGRKIEAQTLSDTLAKDTTDKEAIFGNGTKDWMKYTSQHLKVPDRLATNFKAGTYRVRACFTIDKNGKITDVYLKKSVEWAADESVFDLLKNAPDWKPAIRKGKPFLYRETQDFVMNLD